MEKRFFQNNVKNNERNVAHQKRKRIFYDDPIKGRKCCGKCNASLRKCIKLRGKAQYIFGHFYEIRTQSIEVSIFAKHFSSLYLW
jgi:hypothetical protein